MEPKDIAKLITEDLKINNGLILEKWPESLGKDEYISSNAPPEPGKPESKNMPQIGTEHEFYGRRVRYLGEVIKHGQYLHKLLYLDDPNEFDPTPRGGYQLQGALAMSKLDKNARPL